MKDDAQREPARRPEDLSRLFLERANAGDLGGLVALYEPTAALALPTGDIARGTEAIREAYRELLAGRPTFSAGNQRPPLVAGELALTSTRLLDGSATAEVARSQPDGTWLWVADQPNVLGD
jgi:ketosteroid isomerase-like protein